MRWLALLLVAAACGQSSSGVRTGKLRVVATTGMVADLAIRIGGDRVEVTALMGAGVDPHLYRATQGDLARLRGADLVLYNGKALEGKMGDILVKLARKMPVVAVTDAIPDDQLLEPAELEGHYDPHVWFDVKLWAKTCGVVAEALGKIRPDLSKEFQDRADAYFAELLKLHAEVGEALSAIPRERRVLITSHDAFRYMGRAYDLDVRGVQGISTVSDAGIKDIQDMAELIVKRGVKAIFVESSVNPRAIESVQRAVSAKGKAVKIGGTLFSDAMGDAPPTNTYVGMVRANVATLVGALK